MVFSADGKYLVSGGTTGLYDLTDNADINIWSIETGNLVLTLFGHTASVTSLACFGKYVASGSKDGSVIIWSFDTGYEIHSNKTKHAAPVSSINFTTDCKYVVTRSKDHITGVMWSTETGLEVKDTPFPPLATGTEHYFGDMSVSTKGKDVLLMTRKKKDPVLLRYFGATTTMTCKEAGLEGALLSANYRKLLLQLGAKAG